MNTFTILFSLFSILLGETADVARRVALLSRPVRDPNRSQEEQDFAIYRAALRRLALWVILLPIPVVAIGVFAGSTAPIAIAGLFWAVATLVLLFVAAPLGIALDVLVEEQGLRGAGKYYVRVVMGVLLAELALTLFLAVVPVVNNPGAIPLLVLAAAILGIMGMLGMGSFFTLKLLKYAAVVAVMGITASFFLPKSMKFMGEKLGEVDEKVSAELRNETSGVKRGRVTTPPMYFAPGSQVDFTGYRDVEMTLDPNVSTRLRLPASTDYAGEYSDRVCVRSLEIETRWKCFMGGENLDLGGFRQLVEVRGVGTWRLRR